MEEHRIHDRFGQSKVDHEISRDRGILIGLLELRAKTPRI